MAIFVKVAELGSYTKAARELSISKSFASREVARLEERLSARLLQRTTRRVSLTDVGNTYYERCKSILEQIEEAELAVTELHSVPAGTLRAALPMSYGRMVLMPVVHEFVAEHPQLEMDLSFSDRRIDLVAEGIDLAVRIGNLEDSSLFARRLGEVNFAVCASPSYLAEHGTPDHPNELRGHECVEFTHRYERGNWRFEGPGGELTVRVTARVQANLGEAVVDAAHKGVGIAYVPDFLVRAHFESGELVSLLEDWTPKPVNVWALYPHNRHLSAKVRLLVDRLVERFADKPTD